MNAPTRSTPLRTCIALLLLTFALSAVGTTQFTSTFVFKSGGVEYYGLEFLLHVPGTGNIWVAIPRNHDLEASPENLRLVLDPNPPDGVDVDPGVRVEERPSLRSLQEQVYRLMHDARGATKTARPMLGEIRLWAGNVEPPGYRFCDGRLLLISSHPELFELLGSAFGGDGRNTFGLPDLRGRIPMGVGAGPGLSNRNLGDEPGAESVILDVTQLPSHDHTLRGSNSSANQTTPAGNVLARASTPQYLNATPSVIMGSGSIGAAGSNAPHPNIQPSTVLHFIIAADAAWSRPVVPSAAKWPVLPGTTPPRWKMRLASGPGVRIESDAVTRPPFNAQLTWFTSGGVDYHTMDLIEHEDGVGVIWLAIPAGHDFTVGPVTPLFVLAPDVVHGEFIPWPDWIDDNANGVQDEGESWVDSNGNGYRDLPGERVEPGGNGLTTWRMADRLVSISRVVRKLGMTGWNRGSEFDYLPGPMEALQWLNEVPFENLPGIEGGHITSTTVDMHTGMEFMSGGVLYLGIEMLGVAEGLGTIWVAIPKYHDLEASPASARIVLAPDVVNPT